MTKTIVKHLWWELAQALRWLAAMIERRLAR